MSNPPVYKFRSAEYDRPNHRWVCGGDADGVSCPLGPTHLGVCGAVCTPKRVGDRYYCDYASELHGACDEGPMPEGSCGQVPSQCTPSKQQGVWVCKRGSCETGPFPDGQCSRRLTQCNPVRSVLAKRQMVVTAITGLAIGCLLIVTNFSQRQSVISPGPLTSHHRTMDGCTDCHAAGDGHLAEWIQAAFAGRTDVGQSALCLNCHRDAVGEEAFLAHGVNAATLTRDAGDVSRRDTMAPTLLALAGVTRHSPGEKLACSTCHTEHRGRDFEIARLNDQQCQICHSESFPSFSQGHPEFSSYPYTKRTQLYFNHQTHHHLHFANTSAPLPPEMPSGKETGNIAAPTDTCGHCHEPDGAGASMLLRGFEESCGSCHSHQIADSTVAFINIPTRLVNLPDEDAAARAVVAEFVQSEWLARHETGFMRLLVDVDQTARDGLLGWAAIVEANGDELDVVPVALQDAARRYAAALRSLLEELAGGDFAAAEERLSGVFTAEFQEAFLPAVDPLPHDLMIADRQALIRLLNGLGDAPTADDHPAESNDSKAGVEGGVTGSLLDVADPAGHDAITSRWRMHTNGDVWNLTYQPRSHSDAWLKGWLEVTARQCSASTLDEHGVGDQVSAIEQIFADLAKPATSGRCMKCHTANEMADGSLRIRWSADRPGRHLRKFTDFDHAPHLTLPADESRCDACHQLVGSQEEFNLPLFHPAFVERFNSISTDGSVTETSGFLPMERGRCNTCHQHTDVGEDCLMCHNYHVTELPPRPSMTATKGE